MATPDEIVKFWVHEVGVAGWYAVNAKVDQNICDRFGSDWEAARQGERGIWCTGPEGVLAFLILTDQFPRNMFRGDAQAFATDARARAAADEAIAHGWDVLIDEPERQFFYLPLMHSEDLADQDRCIALMESSLPESAAGNLSHAHAHREIIRRFGRFPYRNDALGRKTTDKEAAFMENGGYGAILRELGSA
ncbi:MAG: DUF924 family protein [Albidovulum sp.]